MALGYRHLLFAAICLIWGSTWAATKLGVDAVPPMFFAGTRFVAAGAMLLAWHWAPRHRRGQSVPLRDLPRLALSSFFLIPLTYTPLYWALRIVPSGLAAVLNSALTPLIMLLLGIAGGEERWSHRQGAAIAIGILGLVLLFGPTAGTISSDPLQALGAGAVVLATFASCAGSVLTRPLLTRHPTVLLSGLSNLLGGTTILLAALAFEPGARHAATGAWGFAAWSGWVYIVFFGTLIGYTFYFVLLRDWGPSRAGTYAFICPIIAVVIGVFAFGESVTFTEAAGMLLMLTGAALALGIGPLAPRIRPARQG
jgi:drug/metabolite transporter (DMT)-like permease